MASPNPIRSSRHILPLHAQYRTSRSPVWACVARARPRFAVLHQRRKVGGNDTCTATLKHDTPHTQLSAQDSVGGAGAGPHGMLEIRPRITRAQPSVRGIKENQPLQCIDPRVETERKGAKSTENGAGHGLRLARATSTPLPVTPAPAVYILAQGKWQTPHQPVLQALRLRCA